MANSPVYYQHRLYSVGAKLNPSIANLSATLSLSKNFSMRLSPLQALSPNSTAASAKIPKQGPLVLSPITPGGWTVWPCTKSRYRHAVISHLDSRHALSRSRSGSLLFTIDFRETKTALKNNIHAKRLALEYLNQDIPILISPSGLCLLQIAKALVAWWMLLGQLRAAIRDVNATVVPVYFHSQNSRRFHLASHMAEPLRMALLLNEVLKKFGHSVPAEIGDPLPWETLAQFDSRQSLTDYLYQRVQALAPSPTRPESRLIKLPRR